MLPTTYEEIFEQTLDRRGRPAGRDPLPRTMEEIHRRALAKRGHVTPPSQNRLLP